MAPLILINDSNRMTLPAGHREPAGAGAGDRRLRRHRGRRRHPRAALLHPLPPPPTSLCARLHVRRSEGLTMLTTRVPATPVHPSTGTVASARARGGAHHRRLLGPAPADQRRGHPAAHRPLARAGGLDRQLRPRCRRTGCPRAGAGGSSPTPRSYKFLEAAAWELGRRPDPALEATFRRFVSRVDGRAGAGRLPEHGVRPARPAAPLVRPGLGARAVLPRPPLPGRRRARAHGARCRRRPARCCPSRCRPRLRGLRRGRDPVRVRARRGRGRPRRAEQGDRRAALPAPGRAVHRAARTPRPARARMGTRLLPGRPARFAKPTVQRGHTVRANYLAAGAVDVAVETGDADLLATLRRVWDRTVARRTYLTGGQGSHFQDEAFGEDWELPPDRAYSETCASIASIMFSWRLLLATGGGALRGPDRAHPLQRRCDSRLPRGRPVLLHQHAAPPGARRDAGPGRGLAARLLEPAGAVVRRVLLPAEHRPDAGEPRRAAGHRRRRRPPAAPVRHLLHRDQPARRHAGCPRRGDRLPRQRDGHGSRARVRRPAVDAQPARSVLGARGEPHPPAPPAAKPRRSPSSVPRRR